MTAFTQVIPKIIAGLGISAIATLTLPLAPSSLTQIPGFSLLATAKAAEIAPYTDSSLTLVGTITSKKGQELALMQTASIPLKFYRIGEKLNGYTLLEITRDHVKLSLKKQHYILYLQQKTLTSIENPTPTTVSRQDHIIIKRELLDHIRNNRQAWLNAVSLRLEMSEGYVSGYLVESINKIPFNSNIGLKEGDIIKTINGISISQPLLFAKTVNNLMEVSDITIQVERDHNLYILNFNIKE